jgi:hypothetical protein
LRLAPEKCRCTAPAADYLLMLTQRVATPAQKCARKPKTIVVLLTANDQEYDRVSLDMAKDFKKIEPSTYVLRSEILLQGPEGTTPMQ